MKAIDLRDARTAAARPRTLTLRAVAPLPARCAVPSAGAGFRRARPRVPRSATGVVVDAAFALPSIVRRGDGLTPVRRTLRDTSGQVPGAPAVRVRGTDGAVDADGLAESRGGGRAEPHPARKPSGRSARTPSGRYRRPRVPAVDPVRPDHRRCDRPARGAGQGSRVGCPGGPARSRPGRSPLRKRGRPVRRRPCRHPAASEPADRAHRQGRSGAAPGRPRRCPGTATRGTGARGAGSESGGIQPPADTSGT